MDHAGTTNRPGDSATFAFEWSFTPPPSPSDGRQGREEDVYFLGYWYPQVAVYDDVNGWVTDPYINGAEFYMDMADYDVRRDGAARLGGRGHRHPARLRVGADAAYDGAPRVGPRQPRAWRTSSRQPTWGRATRW